MGCTNSNPAEDEVAVPSGNQARRRLSVTGAGGAKHQDPAEVKGDVAPATTGSTPPNLGSGREGEQAGDGTRAAALPIYFGTRSRPGNDPMKRRKENQDCFIVQDCFADNDQQMLFCVYDGHGPNGAYASQYVRDRLPGAWKDKLVNNSIAESEAAGSLLGALHDGCVEVNRALHNSNIDVYVSGSTAITSMLRGNKLYVANVGDSRAVCGKQNEDGSFVAVEFSDDHKPDRPDEEQRILAKGGRVFEWGVQRVWLKDVDMPGLAMARSFGDIAAESVGVHAEPEIKEFTLDSSHKFFIFASDGVWEFITSQEAVDILKSYLGASPQEAADAIVAESVRRWNKEEDVVDDTTAIVAFLNYE